MSLQHIDRDIQKLKIHKFDIIADFELAQQQGHIGQDDISIINEEIQVDWNQTDPDAPDFIKNKPNGIQGLQGIQGLAGSQGIQGLQGLTGLQGIQGIQGIDGLQGVQGIQGLSKYDFTNLPAPAITLGATTIVFAANQRNEVEFSTNADLSITLVSNNKSDNYMWITNSHSTDPIDITFSSISYGATTINDVKGTDLLPSIPAGDTLEIGIYVNDTKARITSVIL